MTSIQPEASSMVPENENFINISLKKESNLFEMLTFNLAGERPWSQNVIGTASINGTALF